ncbi:hypothetical protein PQR75_24410 [Paraburkholderia fungorum]|jgi:hypothetical protein
MSKIEPSRPAVAFFLSTERVEAANAMIAFIADEADASYVPLSVSRCR